VDKGILATIGRAAAVASFGKIHLTGLVAWLSWLFIHLMLLIGFRNRLLVLVQWAWSYLTYQRGIRLITGSTDLPRGRCE
jgi:NADH dehydrogenase